MPAVPTSAPRSTQFLAEDMLAGSTPSKESLMLAAGAYRQGEIQSRGPTLRERFRNAVGEALGGDREAYYDADYIANALNVTPVGVVMMIEEAFHKVKTPGQRVPGAIELGMLVTPIARFGGVKALGKIVLANKMERQGASVHDIWRSTGLNRGADGLWRSEIPDIRARTAVVPGTTVGKQLEHPELFQAYPELKNIKYKETAGLPPDWKGEYNQYSNTITLAAGMDPINKRSIMLHELQHAVQYSEGFAYATSGSYLHGQWVRALKVQEDLLRASGRVERADALKQLRETAFKQRQIVNWEAYRRQSGEVEARNVQRRADMPLEDLATMPPSTTEDVARGLQITWKEVKAGSQPLSSPKAQRFGEIGPFGKGIPTHDRVLEMMDEMNVAHPERLLEHLINHPDTPLYTLWRTSKGQPKGPMPKAQSYVRQILAFAAAAAKARKGIR